MDQVEYQSFQSFHDALIPLVAPEGLAEQLTTFYRDQVGNALADIQTIIPFFRSFNVRFVQKSEVNEFCNASIFGGPVGKITQLFAYKPHLDCKRFYYKRVSQAAIDCWMERQRCLCPATVPPSVKIYDSPYCNYVIAGDAACTVPYLTAAEDDCRFARLDDDDRVFAVGPDCKIFAAPRFPCGYVLLLQWQGIRRKWLNTDPVLVDQQIREAVVNYVEHKMALKERGGPAITEYWAEYTLNLRMLKYRTTDEQATELERDCTTALEQLMPAFQNLYASPVYGP